MSHLEEIVNLVDRIPPFPKVAEKVMAMLREPNVTARMLAETIQFDQAITANVLKICNAAHFGLPRKVSSLGEALVVIGHDLLKNVIVASSSSPFYKGSVSEGYYLEEGELWRHSVATAIMARLLVRHFPGVDAGTAFTAALLHDIGKRFLSSFVADEFKKIILLVHRESCCFVEAEKRLLGIDHAGLGAMILDKWTFPPAMVRAIKSHHEADALRQEPLTALVALSNALVISAGIGVGADGLATKLQGDTLKRFNLTQSVLDLCMADLLREMDDASELLHL
jgi:putative nucleotidyltransferase with HDIG domain